MKIIVKEFHWTDGLSLFIKELLDRKPDEVHEPEWNWQYYYYYWYLTDEEVKKIMEHKLPINRKFKVIGTAQYLFGQSGGYILITQ